jgi:hypothetical protein
VVTSFFFFSDGLKFLFLFYFIFLEILIKSGDSTILTENFIQKKTRVIVQERNKKGKDIRKGEKNYVF